MDTINSGGTDWKLAVKNLASKGFVDKTSKQCRERYGIQMINRWLHYLNPSMRNEEFSKEEEDLILTTQKTEGKKWVNIAQRLPGR